MRSTATALPSLVLMYSLTALSCEAETRPQVTVCDLIRNPAKWENRHVTIKGIAKVRNFGMNATIGELVPDQGQTCRYSNSGFSNSSESANILLMYPSQFQPNPPGGSKLDERSFYRAHETLRDLQKSDPSMRRAFVTLDAFVLLRKYSVTPIRPGARPPTDPWTPVVLIVEAFTTVQRSR
jgi:hypothetical protein